jgi:hypothetical protein
MDIYWGITPTVDRMSFSTVVCAGAIIKSNITRHILIILFLHAFLILDNLASVTLYGNYW